MRVERVDGGRRGETRAGKHLDLGIHRLTLDVELARGVRNVHVDEDFTGVRPYDLNEVAHLHGVGVPELLVTQDRRVLGALDVGQPDEGELSSVHHAHAFHAVTGPRRRVFEI